MFEKENSTREAMQNKNTDSILLYIRVLSNSFF